MTHTVDLTMLGRFELACRGRPVSLPASAERVVAYVALHNGPATRSNVAGNLWLDVPEERALANLRSTLWRLRRPGITIIEPVGESLMLSANVAVDLHDLQKAARALVDGNVPTDPSRLDRLTMGGELLGDWYDDWVLVEREHFRQLRLQALERLSSDLAAGGQYARAIESALAAVATEPLRESAHRALISVHLAQGNRSEAIRQYCIYRRLMRDELDLAPSTKMDELMENLPVTAVDRGARLLTPA